MWGYPYPQPPAAADILQQIKAIEELKKYLKEGDKDKDKKKTSGRSQEILETWFIVMLSTPFIIITWKVVGWGWAYLFH